jgi:signal transduction histidine kinase
MRLRSDSSSIEYRRWWLIVPLSLVALLLAHGMALIYRIQPAVSLWFPPSGVAIALTLWFGTVGVVLTGITSILIAPLWGNDGWTQLAGLTDAIEPLVAWLLYRYCFSGSLSLSRLRDAVAFTLSAPVAACATSAIVGSLTLVAVGKMPASDLATSIPHWWLGNAIGTLAIAPTALLVLTPCLQNWRCLPFREQGVKSREEFCLRLVPSFWAEVVTILVFVVATATLIVSKTNQANFAFQQLSFLSFIPILWAATRFGVKGGMLTSSFCVLVTLLAYLLAYPNAISLPNFPVPAEVLHVHKLSLLVQCAVSLFVGCAITERAATMVVLAVERVRAQEHQARIQLSEQLIQLNSELTEANSRLEQSNRDKEELLKREQIARAQAEAANRMKDDFLAVLSHELRTPLNPVLGWSRLLQSRKYDEATLNKALETIERNAKLLMQLIEDLLDVSGILQGQLSLNVSPVDLVPIIEAAIETVHLAAEAKSIQIQTVLQPNVGQVSGDRNRLQQVVWNLLSNAVKFTPPGGRVEVQLLSLGTQAQIRVSDTGSGISKEFLPFVFDYFRQADSTSTRSFGGLGLGLAIVRRLVELHGGTVQAQSPGAELGATFTVSFPLIKVDSNRSETKMMLDQEF